MTFIDVGLTVFTRVSKLAVTSVVSCCVDTHSLILAESVAFLTFVDVRFTPITSVSRRTLTGVSGYSISAVSVVLTGI